MAIQVCITQLGFALGNVDILIHDPRFRLWVRFRGKIT